MDGTIRGAGGWARMLAVMAVLLLGLGIGACGLLEPGLYFVGAELLFIGAVGLAVRAADLINWWRRTG